MIGLYALVTPPSALPTIPIFSSATPGHHTPPPTPIATPKPLATTKPTPQYTATLAPLTVLTPLPSLKPSPIPSTLPNSPEKNAAAQFARTVLTQYETRSAATRTPTVLTFEYTVEQAGDRTIAQMHRIYRNGALERDEIFGSGIAKSKPRIRIYRNRPNAYAFENVAPHKAMYTFAYVGRVRVGQHLDYLFHTMPLGHGSAFIVTDVVIDSQTYLPAAVNFTTVSGLANGRGSLRYGEVESHWVITEAEATAQVGKKRMREHFLFTNYRFPQSLPSSTFGTVDTH